MLRASNWVPAQGCLEGMASGLVKLAKGEMPVELKDAPKAASALPEVANGSTRFTLRLGSAGGAGPVAATAAPID
jgi:hypothetical protein